MWRIRLRLRPGFKLSRVLDSKDSRAAFAALLLFFPHFSFLITNLILQKSSKFLKILKTAAACNAAGVCRLFFFLAAASFGPVSFRGSRHSLRLLVLCAACF